MMLRVKVLVSVIIKQCTPRFRYLDKTFFINLASS